MVGKYVRFVGPMVTFFCEGFEDFLVVSVCPGLSPRTFLARFALVSFLRAEKGSISVVRTVCAMSMLWLCVEPPTDEMKRAECDVVCS